MSALGQKRTFAAQSGMSALTPKADMCSALAHVCFGPKADITAIARHGIKEAAMVRPLMAWFEIVSGPIYISAMSPSTHYWTLHWLRVLLWPVPVLSLIRAGRWAVSAIRRR